MSDKSDSGPEDQNPTPPVTIDGQSSAVLPLRDIVVFPHMIVPLFVGREKSVRALEEVMKEEKQILLLTQKSAGDDDPSADGLYRIGTLATVLQLLKLPDQTVRVLVEGKSRAQVKSFSPRADYFEAIIGPVEEEDGAKQEVKAGEAYDAAGEMASEAAVAAGEMADEAVEKAGEMAADAADSANDAYLEAKEKAEDTTDKGGKGTEATGG